MSMTAIEVGRVVVLDHIRKTSRSAEAERYGWLGCPVSHFGTYEGPALRSLIADGVVEIVERPKLTNPAVMARFVRVVPVS
jgi:hypothetical protein